MKEFDWENAYDGSFIGCCWDARNKFEREEFMAFAKKYAAHELRKLAQHYREVLWKVTKEGVVLETEYFASKLDPQPDVIQLEKGKVYRFPDGAEVRT